MRVQSSTRLAALAVLVGALACAGNTAREADTDETAAARDTTVSDTLGADVQNPPGYRGMERDTTIVPPQEPADTFLENQGAGTPQDTAGYSGMERVDTTGQANQQGQDTTSYGADTTTTPGMGQDTTGMAGQDTTGWAGQDTTGVTGQDTSWTNQSGDTTGYDPSQQPQDTASSR
ncbi:MAG TPA: hypothetical protein VFO71_05970 [Gemmatimonadales bacterium]|nr:hypothetical protein [Gemmatimonadales bacterium]